MLLLRKGGDDGLVCADVNKEDETWAFARA
jgi:hypothetical protein